jgi:hypothetical protein
MVQRIWIARFGRLRPIRDRVYPDIQACLDKLAHPARTTGPSAGQSTGWVAGGLRMTATSTLARCAAYDATERIGAHLTSDCFDMRQLQLCGCFSRSCDRCRSYVHRVGTGSPGLQLPVPLSVALVVGLGITTSPCRAFAASREVRTYGRT